jgi:hypothetical protein
MRTLLAALIALTATTSLAHANFGYCFAPGLMGGTKVFVHDDVHEADFWDGATVKAYRKLLEDSHRFRFGPLTCPGFDTEQEARDSLAKARRASLDKGFAEFLFPPRNID